MKRMRIIHHSRYIYREPVVFHPHRAMLRPREGHDVHIATSTLQITPAASVRWVRDIYGNSIAVIFFSEPSQELSLLSEIDVDLYDNEPISCLIDPEARQYPFQYAITEKIDLIRYQLPSYPHDGPAVRRWLLDIYQPGQLIETLELLEKLNTRIYESFGYARREDPGVQLPCETLARRSGSCRDYAVFMMEAARHWGFGSRFVTGYIQLGEGQHGATHAWTEIYVPGLGWRGFDPTNNMLAGIEHVSVAVAREQDQAMPLTGAWEGPSGAFERMDVSVQVIPVSNAT
jgi:transglutaminase-like putative cysteine protease